MLLVFCLYFHTWAQCITKSVIFAQVLFWELLQNRIGADIIMALDDVVRTTITGPRIEEAMYRTLRWIDRCIAGNLVTLDIFMYT